MAGRQSKWKRAKNPQRLILQPRDKEIVTQVYEFGILSRSQIQRLFNLNSVTRVNIRLRKLYDHHYLSRTFVLTARGSAKAIYFLGRGGIDIITEKLGIDPLEVKRNQREVSQLKSLFLSHHLNVNEVRIAITRATLENPLIKLELWINDYNCRQEYYLNDFGKKVKKVFRPDGYFRLSYQGKLYSFFLELDQSTMSQPRIKAKVKTYLEFARSGYYQKIFGVRYFQVLIIAPSIKRTANLKKTVEEITNKIFWFTVLNKAVSADVFGPVWLRAGRSGLHSLIGS